MLNHKKTAWFVLLLQLAVLKLLWSPLKQSLCRRCPARRTLMTEKKVIQPRTIAQPINNKLGLLALHLQIKKERVRRARIKAWVRYTLLRQSIFNGNRLRRALTTDGKRRYFLLLRQKLPLETACKIWLTYERPMVTSGSNFTKR